jgi:hypothetical protein
MNLYRKPNVGMDQVQQTGYAVTPESQPVPMDLIADVDVRAEPFEYFGPDA